MGNIVFRSESSNLAQTLRYMGGQLTVNGAILTALINQTRQDNSDGLTIETDILRLTQAMRLWLIRWHGNCTKNQTDLINMTFGRLDSRDGIDCFAR